MTEQELLDELRLDEISRLLSQGPVVIYQTVEEADAALKNLSDSEEKP